MLTNRAVMRAAPGDDHSANRGFADQAWLPGTHVDEVAKLKEAALTCGIDIIGDRGAAQPDRFAQHFL